MTQDPTLRSEFEHARDALDRMLQSDEHFERLDRFAREVANRLERGSKILAVGNGGSACDAMHFCEELTGRFRDDRRPLPAIACSDPGYLTCTANDYGYEEVFSRWVRGLGNQGDILVAISTSGNSTNVVNAVAAAKERGLLVATLLGKDGGALRDTGDFQWIVPGDTADRIQELHMLLLHSCIHGIERALF